MLIEQSMSVVQLIHGNADLQIALRQCHVLVHLRTRHINNLLINQNHNASYLERLVEISDLTQIVQKLIYPRLVVLHERIEGDHVRLLRIGGLVGKILQHLGNLMSLPVRQSHN